MVFSWNFCEIILGLVMVIFILLETTDCSVFYWLHLMLLMLLYVIETATFIEDSLSDMLLLY